MIYRIQTYTKVKSGNWDWDDVWCYKDGAFDVGDTQWTEAANSIGSLTFDVYPTNEFYDWLDVNKRIRILNAEGWTDTGDYYGYKCVFAGRVIEVTPQMDDDGLVHKEVVCEDALGFLQDSVAWFDSEKSWFDGGGSYSVDIDGDGVRTIGAEDYIRLIVNQHNNTVDAHDSTMNKHIYIGELDLQDYGDDDDNRKTTEQLKVDIDAIYDKTSYELLSEVCDELNAQFSVTYPAGGVKAYLNVKRKLGAAHTDNDNRVFKVADNIAQSSLETSMSSVATRVFPWGDEYAKLKTDVRSGVDVKGRLDGSDWKTTSVARMVRFDVEGGLKVHVTIGKRNKDYAMLFFTSKAITTSNCDKDGVVLQKYITKAKETSTNIEKWYPVPEDAKYCYVFGPKSEGTKLTLYSEYKRTFSGSERTIKDKYKVGLGFWLKYLKNADKKAALRDFGVTLGSITDKSNDTLYFLGANEDKFGIVESAVDIDRCHLKTEKITDSNTKITSIEDCVTVGKKKTAAWRRKRARLFFREACRQASKLCNKSMTISATAYDMRAGRDESYPELHLYDEWRMFNDKCGIDHVSQVMRIQRDLREPWKVTVEFGDEASRYTSSTGKGTSMSKGASGVDSSESGDFEEDSYATALSAAAQAAASEAIAKAEELDKESYQITVDAQAAGSLASKAYEQVSPITTAMRNLLSDAEEQASKLTSVIDRQEKTISLSNELANATAIYACETEKSVVRWRQTYTANLDAWASDDAEVQKTIVEAYQKLYGGIVAEYETTGDDGEKRTKYHCVDANGNETGPLNVQSDSAQGRLNTAKAERVVAAQTKAEMEAKLTEAESYLSACNSAVASLQETYNNAKSAYDKAKKKAKKASTKKSMNAAYNTYVAAAASLEAADAKVSEAEERCKTARENYGNAVKDLQAAEAKVIAAEEEVDTAMNGIHEKYSTTIEQTAKAITFTASSVEGITSYMEFTDNAGTGTLTLGGKSSKVIVGQNNGSNVTINSGGNIDIMRGNKTVATFSGGSIHLLDVSFETAEYNNQPVMKITAGDGVIYMGGGIGVNIDSWYSSCKTLTTDYWLCCKSYINCYGQIQSKASDNTGCYMNENIGSTVDGRNSCGTSSHRFSKVYAKNGTIDTSSREVKENIEPESEEKAQRLLNIEVVKFDYKKSYWGSDDNKGWYGVIAEDVHDEFPEVVIDWDADDETDEVTGETTKVYPGVTYSAFIPHLIKLCQLQQTQIDALTARVDALENGTATSPFERE